MLLPPTKRALKRITSFVHQPHPVDLLAPLMAGVQEKNRALVPQKPDIVYDGRPSKQ
jgi:hypothetical protein